MKFPHPASFSFRPPFLPPLSLIAALFLSLIFFPFRAVSGAADAPPAAPPGFGVQTVPVNYLPAAEMKKLLQAVVSPGGAVLDQPGEKSLTVVDAPENIRRLIEIRDLIDLPEFAGARLDVFQPKIASAGELSAQLTELLKNQVLPASGTFFAGLAPLPGSNQILVVSDGERAWNFIRPWLERLDTASGSRRRVFIYPVERSKLAELEEKLKRAWEDDPAAPPDPSAGNKPRVKVDRITATLIIYGTAQDFLEIKKAVDPGQLFEQFKQKLTAIRQDFASRGKKPAPAS